MSDDGLDALLRRSAPLVRRLERRFGGSQQAEDAVQEALIRAWQLRARGDDVTSWEAWLATTAANALRTELRSRAAEQRALGRLAAVEPHPAWHPAMPEGDLGDLGEAVGRLPPRERDVVVLHYVADLAVADIAGRLGIAEGTVKRALHDARRRLAEAVERGPEVPENRRSRRTPVEGWIMAGSHPAEYTFEIERTDGKPPVGVLASTVGEASGFGTFMQLIQARKYIGSRLQLSGDAAIADVDGWFGFWLRVDGERQGQPLAFDNMESRHITGTRGWGRYEVVLDVPEGAAAIAFGVLLVGTGTVRVSGLRLAEVGLDVPVTGKLNGPLPDEPVNLDFAAE